MNQELKLKMTAWENTASLGHKKIVSKGKIIREEEELYLISQEIVANIINDKEKIEVKKYFQPIGTIKGKDMSSGDILIFEGITKYLEQELILRLNEYIDTVLKEKGYR